MTEEKSSELDDLVAGILEIHKNRSPRAVARDMRRMLHWENRELTPERERILANMRHPHAYYKAIMDRQQELALQDTLTEDDKDALAQTHLDLADCPYLQPAEVMMGFLGEGPPHYEAFLQEWLWDNLWWVHYLDHDLDTYLDSISTYGPLTRAAIKASQPMPDGYVVSTRRPSRGRG